MQHLPVLALYGPTASGKSALALELAEAIDAVIINADSKQVCRELPIITAQPNSEETAAVSHALYGMVSVTENYPADRWADDAREAGEGAFAAGQYPLFVGGTGMYHELLSVGRSAVPEPSFASVREAERIRERLGPEETLQLLGRHDPVTAARLFPADMPRVIRALSVFLDTGTPLSVWHAAPKEPLFPGRAIMSFVLLKDRAENYAAADHRFDAMIRAGAYEEAAACLTQAGEEAFFRAFRTKGDSRPFLKAHGLPELAACLTGRMARPEAEEQAKRNTRRYIKRQFTWAGGRMKDAARCQRAADIVEALRRLS